MAVHVVLLSALVAPVSDRIPRLRWWRAGGTNGRMRTLIHSTQGPKQEPDGVLGAGDLRRGDVDGFLRGARPRGRVTYVSTPIFSILVFVSSG
jgi:hypothetical protein